MRTLQKNSRPGVLIVGAGPTGLALANALAVYDVPFDIVDRKSGPCNESKALALNVLSQYGLELLGLEGHVGQNGGVLNRINLYWQGRRLSAVDMSHLDFHLQSAIVQPQADTEEELESALSQSGHRVEWLTTLVALEQSGSGVDAVLEGPSGQVIRHYAYAVGCDGKGSLVRSAIGAGFHGHDYPMYFVVGDFPLRFDRPRNQGYYYVYDDTFFIILPVGKDGWRVVVKHDGPVPADVPVKPEEITDVVSQFLGPEIFADKPTWLSRAPFYLRLSDKLRSQRLFLAGDAAHLYSPIGGTGMNTGIQDALNLAWKLAFAHHGLGSDQMLASYEQERLEIIRTTAAVTDLSTRLITRVETSLDLVKPMLPRMANRTALRARLPVMHSGLGVACPEAFKTRGGQPCSGSRRAGELCPGLGALLATCTDGPACRLPVLTLIARLSRHADVRSLDSLRPLLQWGKETGALRLVILTPDVESQPLIREGCPDAHVVCPDAALVRRIGAAPGALMLVHPNAVIGYSGAIADGPDLIEQFQPYIAGFKPVFADARSAPQTVSETLAKAQ